MKRSLRMSCMLSALLVTANATGDTTNGAYNEMNLSLNYALDIAKAAVDSCTESGYKVSVAVLDNKGVLKAQATADGAFLHSAEAAQRKAYASVSRGLPSHKIQEHIVTNSDYNTAMNFSALGMSTWGGGFPIQYKGNIIGAVGVSGAPSGQADVACAEKALADIGKTYASD